MRAAHTPTRHAYLIGRRFLECDVFINLPKLKSHQKAGITCALKNLVGINAHKDYLPHFRFGSPSAGGDEYPDGNWLWHLLWWLRHQEWERDRGRQKQLWAFMARVATALLPVLARRPRTSTSLGGAMPDSTMRMADSRNGMSNVLTVKPGRSVDRSTCLPSDRPLNTSLALAGAVA